MARKAVLIPDPEGLALLEEEMHRLCERMTEGVERSAQKNWDAHVETGKTRASVRAEHLGLTGRVYVQSKVWHFVEYGTSPHHIAAHGPYVLRNVEKRFFPGRSVVFHPGNAEFAPMRHAVYRRRDAFGLPISPSVFGGL